MGSLIVRTAARLLLPLLVLFSVFLLLRGHEAPGGGFVGGLVAAGAVILLALSGGLRAAEAVFPAAYARTVMGAGLLVAGLAASLSLFLGQPFMKGLWVTVKLPALGPVELGTPLLFDLGVYIVVLGMTLTVVLHLIAEVERWKP